MEPKDRRLLVVDDDPDSLEIIAEALKWEGYQVELAPSGHEAIALIQKWNPHLVLLDVNMPGMNGVQTLADLRAKAQYVSVMFISGNSSTEAVISGLDAGADDYIPKPFDPLELLARVRTQLRIKDLNDQLRSANEKLKELVDTDDLTGLYNMRSLYQRLDFELERARRFGRQVCVVMMDMDHFKGVNDGHDHLFGSFVLSEVGAVIRDNIRSIDIGARYGGDEFLMVLAEVNTEGALHFCERLRQSVATRTYRHGNDEMHLTCSIGFAITSAGMNIYSPPIESKELVRLADNALYDAKRAGRNCVKYREMALPVSTNPKKDFKKSSKTG